MAVVFNYAFSPATRPLAHAQCKLNPPKSPATSITSPAKYKFETILLSIVLGLTSFVDTPPLVIIALFILSSKSIEIAKKTYLGMGYDIDKLQDANMTFGDRVADRVSEVAGSWGFIILSQFNNI